MCSKNQGEDPAGIHAGKLYCHRAGFCVGNLQCGGGGMGRIAAAGHPQSGIHCLPFAAARLCQSSGVYQYPSAPSGAGHSFAAPAQRPRQRCSGSRAGIAGGRAAGGRDLVWQWGTHRKCGFGYFSAQSVFPRSRPSTGPFRPAKGRTDVRGIHRYADFSASPIRRRTGICRLFRLPSGCDCQRLSLEKAASEFPVECSLSAVGPTGHWAQL